jgi:hypothetical protein
MKTSVLRNTPKKALIEIKQEPTIDVEQDRLKQKMDWENKQNSLKKRTMYVPTSIPGQVRLVEID